MPSNKFIQKLRDLFSNNNSKRYLAVLAELEGLQETLKSGFETIEVTQHEISETLKEVRNFIHGAKTNRNCRDCKRKVQKALGYDEEALTR